MTELIVDIPPGLYKAAGEELNNPRIKALLGEAVEQKIRVLLLFKAVDEILSKSGLSDVKADELAEELRSRVAERHGIK